MISSSYDKGKKLLITNSHNAPPGKRCDNLFLRTIETMRGTVAVDRCEEEIRN